MTQHHGHATGARHRVLSAPFDVLQLVWTDPSGLLPWHETFGKAFTFRQPMLDRPRNFKFYADRLHRVLTCRQHTAKQAPITRVRHNEEGTCTFLTDSGVSNADLREVSLGFMVEWEPSLNNLFDLDEGYQAEKSGNMWMRSKIVTAATQANGENT